VFESGVLEPGVGGFESGVGVFESGVFQLGVFESGAYRQAMMKTPGTDCHNSLVE
jgi:hypothetical protein